jgi:transcriptional regulator with XRE-family HTH domain
VGGLGSGRPRNESRRREAVRLRTEGLTLVEIGRRLGVTRQRVEQILRAIDRERVRRVTCRVCGCAATPPGAAPNDVTEVLCLTCLAQDTEAPFAERLKSCRTAAGLRRNELAPQVGLTVQTLRVYESGAREPHWQQVTQLVRVLGPALLPLEAPANAEQVLPPTANSAEPDPM